MLITRESHSFWELLCGVVMISFSAVFVKLAHVGPSSAAFYRMAFGAIVLVAIALLTGTRLWYGWRPFFVAALAGVFFAGDLAFWHRSIHYVGPGLATILASFQVFFVTAFAIAVLKERPNWRVLLAVPLALFGLFLLVGTQWKEMGDNYHNGVFFGLITAIFYSSYVLTLRWLQSIRAQSTPIANITVASLTTAFFSAFIVLGVGETFAIPDLPSLSWLVLYGVCGQVLGWVLIARNIKHLPAARVSLTLLLQPVLSFVWDVVFFQRPTLFVEIIGALVAIFAIYLGAWQTQQEITPRQI
ncbi:MAG: DMT family transporter [Candidatus Zixiibacteriota bacterium]